MVSHAVRFTIDELREHAARALAVGYEGPADSRARAVPDLRTLRYYAAIGLLDRPVEMRGRTALYARRHLLQVVAVKRLQADGLALAAIQAELTGITDSRLERVARLPDPLPPSDAAVVAAGAGDSERVWAHPPASAAPSSVWDAGRTALLPAEPRGAEPSYRDAPPSVAPIAASPAVPVFVPVAAVRDPASSNAHRGDLIAAIRLGEGVTLLVDSGRVVPPEEIETLRAAAAPLMSALAEHGLFAPP